MIGGAAGAATAGAWELITGGATGAEAGAGACPALHAELISKKATFTRIFLRWNRTPAASRQA